MGADLIERLGRVQKDPARIADEDKRVGGGRRTQAERTAKMRKLLIDSTIDCLIEAGYAHCSTQEILKRAGVSRGALFHHFASKAELIAEAVWQNEKTRLSAHIEVVNEAAANGASLEEQLRLAWSPGDDYFMVFNDFRIAVRNDPELRAAYFQAQRNSPSLDANTSRVAWATAPGDPSPLLSRYVVGCFLNGLRLSTVFTTAEELTETLEKFALILEKGLAAMETGA